MIIYEAKPSTPSIKERKAVEIKGQRVYFTQRGKRYSEDLVTSYAALCLTKEEAVQHCVDYANAEIQSLKKKLDEAYDHLEKCKNL